MPTTDLLITKGLSETLAPPGAKTKGDKGWLTTAALPPLLRRDAAPAPADATATLLAALEKQKRPTPALLEPYTEASCDELGWALLHAWIRGRGPSAGVWTPFAVAVLGDPRTTPRKLAQMVRKLARDKCVAASVHLIDAIAQIEGDAALIELSKLDGMPKEIGAAAQEHAKRITRRRGLDSEDVQDLLVPDCSLGAGMVLDFGPRKFQVVFDDKLVPSLRDEAGKPVASLPRPGKKDDPQKAEAAREAWNDAKALLKDTLRGESRRFEWAMCAERRWNVDRFKAAVVGHPILRALAQRLVFGSYPGDEVPAHTATFRIAEDGTFADVHDEPFEPTGWIGIPHVLQLSAAELSAWGSLFADYTIIQPFPQLGRDSYSPTPEERDSSEVLRVKHRALDPKARFVLESLGWEENDGDWSTLGFACTLVDGQTRVFINLGSKFDTSSVQIEGVWLQGNKKLGQLDPISFSELLRDLHRLPGRKAQA